MANYVSNYLFCSREAKEKLLSLKYEYVYEIYRGFGETVIPTSEDAFIVMFDTRGMEYRTDFIEKFITEFKDTIWYCVEENEIEEGSFHWNGEMVEFNKHVFDEEFPGREISIRYSDDENRTVLVVRLSDKKIVINNYLRNKSSTYRFSEDSSVAINEYVETLVPKDSGYSIQYAVPVKNGISRCLNSWHWGKDIYIDSYTEDEDWQKDVPDGEDVFNNFISFLEGILAKENIEATISINESILEA